MLSKTQADNSVNAAERVTYSGLLAEPKSTTPLEFIRNQTVVIHDDVDSRDELAGILIADTNRPLALIDKVSADGISVYPHANALREMAGIHAKRLGNSFAYAKNTIAPVCKAVVKRCEEEINGGVWKDINVVTNEIPKVYRSPLLSTLARSILRPETNSSDTSQFKDIEGLNAVVGDLTLSMVRDVMHLGVAEFDEQLDALLAVPDVAEIAKHPSNLLNGYFKDGVDGWNLFHSHGALLSYLFATGLLNGNGGFFDNQAATLDEVGLLKTIARRAGWAIQQRLAVIASSDEHGKIILKRDNYNVFVNASAYNAWLKEGGSVEGLLGYCLQHSSDMSTSSADMALKTAPDHWTRVYKQHRMRESAVEQVKLNRVIDKVVYRGIVDALQEEHGAESAVCHIAIDKAAKQLKETRYYSAMDLNNYVLQCVCKIMSNDKNDSYEILMGIRQYLDENPEGTMTQAKRVAATKLVCKWLVSQIDIRKQG